MHKWVLDLKSLMRRDPRKAESLSLCPRVRLTSSVPEGCAPRFCESYLSLNGTTVLPGGWCCPGIPESAFSSIPQTFQLSCCLPDIRPLDQAPTGGANQYPAPALASRFKNLWSGQTCAQPNTHNTTKNVLTTTTSTVLSNYETVLVVLGISITEPAGTLVFTGRGVSSPFAANETFRPGRKGSSQAREQAIGAGSQRERSAYSLLLEERVPKESQGP